MTISPYIRDLRSAVGNRRLLVPSVAGLVRDGDRLLLVQDRESGRWSTPGGAIEMDETPVDAVVREVWEETGLRVTPQSLLAVYGGPDFVVQYPNGDETQYISAMFECRVESGELRADGDETQAVRFLTLDEARRLPLSPWLEPVLPRLFDGSIGDLTQGRPMSPTNKNGKICYIEVPAIDAQKSADFYGKVFRWNIRKRGDGAIAFDDTTGEVSGAFVVGRPPQTPGLVVYIMVDNVATAIDAVVAAGGHIVQPIGGDPGEITARFRDPGGNIIALYQEPPRG